jgi:hypothetical protein
MHGSHRVTTGSCTCEHAETRADAFSGVAFYRHEVGIEKAQMVPDHLIERQVGGGGWKLLRLSLGDGSADFGIEATVEIGRGVLVQRGAPFNCCGMYPDD